MGAALPLLRERKTMSNLNQTPAANRVHIAFFGRRNAGKSSLVNAVTGQTVSIVSDVKGTTTDPVQKAMELLPVGPVLIIDTPGMDDEGGVGELRVQRARQVLNKTDIAVLVIDGSIGRSAEDEMLVALFEKKGVPYITVYNKADLKNVDEPEAVHVSAETGEGIEALKEKLASLAKAGVNNKKILGDLLESGDHVVLVTPIDESAPKGRMILPQVQSIRGILDARATCSVTQVEELPGVLKGLSKPPRMVVTDSQAFGKVKNLVPEEIELTSFSILFARYKGVLETAIRGAASIETLEDGDTVLISEGCTHHRQCGDIGTVKLPAWIKKHTGKDIRFAFTSGGTFPEDLSPYKLVVHCGGCMLNEREMQNRQTSAEESRIPYTNYGILIAYINGILKRSLAPFEEYKNMI